MIRLGKIAFLQLGAWGKALAAQTLVVDLNPRSLTAWILLLSRNILRKRTLVWGHISPKAGPNAPTAPLRKMMRRISQGTISYTYTDRNRALGDLPGKPVWVAANALYTRDQLLARAVGQQGSPERDTVLYVGRLEPEKKTMLLIEALPYIPSHLRLGIAGTGSLRAEMERRAVELGVAPRVDFHGWVDDLEALRVLYAKAVCSISPGFAGLGLTQSAGFGVPQVVSRDEKHSPEIELEAAGAVVWFDTDSVEDLAEKVTEISRSSSTLPRRELIGAVASTYSADRMADGISDALLGKQDSYGDER